MIFDIKWDAYIQKIIWKHVDENLEILYPCLYLLFEKQNGMSTLKAVCNSSKILM